MADLAPSALLLKRLAEATKTVEVDPVESSTSITNDPEVTIVCAVAVDVGCTVTVLLLLLLVTIGQLETAGPQTT